MGMYINKADAFFPGRTPAQVAGLFSAAGFVVDLAKGAADRDTRSLTLQNLTPEGPAERTVAILCEGRPQGTQVMCFIESDLVQRRFQKLLDALAGGDWPAVGELARALRLTPHSP